MTTETTIFGADQSPVAPPQETPPPVPVVAPETPPVVVPTVSPELLEMIGEGKKYKTLEDAQKSIPHAQNHINTLEADNASMREELTKRKTAEELLNDIRNSSQQPVATTPGVEVNQDVVSEIVKKQLAINSQETLQKQNTSLVVDTFTNIYGDNAKAKEMFSKVASDNGMTISQMETLAATTPKAVLNLAGLTSKPGVIPGNITSDVNTQANFNSTPAVATAKVANYGKTADVTDAMKRAKEIVNQKLI